MRLVLNITTKNKYPRAHQSLPAVRRHSPSTMLMDSGNETGIGERADIKKINNEMVRGINE